MIKSATRNQAPSAHSQKRVIADAGHLRAGALRGFTLIEMIVAVGIFMFVMVIAIGSLVAIVGADRKAQSIEAVVDNLRFALDDMSRTIRTGTAFHCGSSSGGDCTSGTNTGIWLTDQLLNKVSYKFDSTCSGFSGYPGGCIEYACIAGASCTNASFQPITSSELNIQKLNFYVIGSCPKSPPSGTCTADSFQPKVTIVLYAQITQGLTTPTNLNLETTVTQRAYDQ